MNYLQSRARLKKLGRKLSIEGKIEQEIECLDISLGHVDAIRDMVATDGWEIWSSQLREFVDQQSSLIVECAADPDKNRDKQIVCYAMMKMGKRLLGLVASALNEAPYLENRKRELTNG